MITLSEPPRVLFATATAGLIVLLSAVAGAQASDSAARLDSAAAVPANEGSLIAGISADGRYVLFASFASNLVAGDTNRVWDDFVRDMVAKTTERVSVTNSGGQTTGQAAVMTPHARFVAFSSQRSSSSIHDVLVRDRVAKTTERVNVSSSGAQANAPSELGSISDDGRYVTFSSQASNLVSGDTNNARDTFIRDRVAGTTERLSVSSAGTQANGDSGYGLISGDGRFIAFGSDASNLVSGDTNDSHDVFLRNRVTGTTERLIVSGAPAGQTSASAISSDGHDVAVEVDHSNDSCSVYVIDTAKNTSELVSVDSSGRRIAECSSGPVMSADGRYVAFDTANGFDKNMARKWGDVFLRDRVAKTTERISVNATGKGGNAGSFSGGISSDGRYVAFQSDASNLVPGDTNICGDEGDNFNCSDVFVRDRVARTTILVSVGRKQAPEMTALRRSPWPPRAGRALTVTSVHGALRPRIECAATLAGKKLKPSAQSNWDYTARCVWKIPTNARGKQLKGSLTLVTPYGTGTKRFTATVR